MATFTPQDELNAREALASSMRVRIVVIALVQAAIWASHALLYEDLIFSDRTSALYYRLAQLAHCLGLLWLAARPRSMRSLEWGSTLLFASILPVHGLAMQVVNEPCFVPFLLTMEWGQGIIALAALLSYKPSLLLLATAWVTGVVTVLLRPGFDPDLSDHVVLLLIYAVVAASIRSLDTLRASELAARRELAAVQREQALRGQREEFLGELHDGVSAALARASLLLEASERAHQESKRQTLVEKARNAVEGALAEARSLLTLREKSSVSVTVTALRVEQALKDSVQGFDVDVSSSESNDESVASLSAAAHHALCRVASEAATNAVKHGRATRLVARLLIERGALVLTIENDVVSGTPDQLRHLRSAGFGLRAAGRRITRLGGELSAGLVEATAEGVSAWLVTARLPAAEAASESPAEPSAAERRHDQAA